MSNITLKDEYVNAQLTPGEPADYAWYHDLMLHPYMDNTVGMARASRWRLDGQGQPADFAYDWARQFAYDPDPRARYLDREAEPAGPDFERLGDEHWTDYLGGTGVSPVAYSAFGEILNAGGNPGGGSGGPPGQIPAGFPRYQYAGGWGYESPAGDAGGGGGGGGGGFPGAPGGLTLAGVNPNLPPITLMHVGWRWYDPALGRFVQRDPIGIEGGLNVYEYCGNDPLTEVDPAGLQSFPPGREYWEHMRRFNAAIARLLKQAWKSDIARERLRGAIAGRNALFRARFGPLVLTACIQYAIDRAQVAADDWHRRHGDGPGIINRRRISRMGGFSGRDSDELWGY